MSKKSKAVVAVPQEPIAQEPIAQEPIAQEPVNKPAREQKRYGISIGKLPEANQKPLGLHGVIITEAITDLVNEGKDSATRDEIMTKACELGLFDRKPSRQGVIPIFAWWRRSLRDLGWISY